MEIFLAAPLYIQIHALAALIALFLGPVALYRKRRDIWHKTVGYIWMTSMVTVSISSFWISSFGVIGPFSPIHLLSIWTLLVVVRSIQFAKRRNIAGHMAMLKGLYWGGLWVAFALNFLPYRMSNRIVFGGERAEIGMMIVILGIAAAFLIGRRWTVLARGLRAA